MPNRKIAINEDKLEEIVIITTKGEEVLLKFYLKGLITEVIHDMLEDTV